MALLNKSSFLWTSAVILFVCLWPSCRGQDRKFLEDYGKCGDDEAFCVGSPNGCIEHLNCDLFLHVNNSAQNNFDGKPLFKFYVRQQGKGTENAYNYVYFSKDRFPGKRSKNLPLYFGLPFVRFPTGPRNVGEDTRNYFESRGRPHKLNDGNTLDFLTTVKNGYIGNDHPDGNVYSLVVFTFLSGSWKAKQVSETDGPNTETVIYQPEEDTVYVFMGRVRALPDKDMPDFENLRPLHVRTKECCARIGYGNGNDRYKNVQEVINVPPPPEPLDDYSKCDEAKAYCVGSPNGCIQTRTCDLFLYVNNRGAGGKPLFKFYIREQGNKEENANNYLFFSRNRIPGRKRVGTTAIKPAYYALPYIQVLTGDTYSYNANKSNVRDSNSDVQVLEDGNSLVFRNIEKYGYVGNSQPDGNVYSLVTFQIPSGSWVGKQVNPGDDENDKTVIYTPSKDLVHVFMGREDKHGDYLLRTKECCARIGNDKYPHIQEVENVPDEEVPPTSPPTTTTTTTTPTPSTTQPPAAPSSSTGTDQESTSEVTSTEETSTETPSTANDTITPRDPIEPTVPGLTRKSSTPPKPTTNDRQKAKEEERKKRILLIAIIVVVVVVLVIIIAVVAVMFSRSKKKPKTNDSGNRGQKSSKKQSIKQSTLDARSSLGNEMKKSPKSTVTA